MFNSAILLNFDFSVESFLLPALFIPLLTSSLALLSWGVDRAWLLHKILVLMALNAILSFLVWLTVVFGDFFYVLEVGNWVSSGGIVINWNFIIDPLSASMFVVVSTISAAVHFYSTEYMQEDPHLTRFMGYLSLFTFFMLILVASNNLLGLFLGWEGIGLCSYLLIGFWTTRVQANKAAIKAMVVNRIADVFLTAGLVTMLFFYQSLDFSIILGSSHLFNTSFIFISDMSIPLFTLITLFLFLGAMGKSAQLGLHTWLPDAMEGPTPVSALIHAATLVTAGIFLMIRCSSLFERAPTTLLFVGFIGAATAFFAATSGLMQNDLKKIIAYSTCSQLGYMTFTCALSQYHLSFFHLANHAFFKALLFLSAGALIHGVGNEQDLRRYGALSRLLPYSYVMLLIGSVALMGFPFLTGFYSKDLILEIAAATAAPLGLYTWWFGLLTAFCTAFYSLRLVYLAFFTANNSFRATLPLIHELPMLMGSALATLALGSIFMGYYGRDLFVGWGTQLWNGTILMTFSGSQYALESEFLPTFIKLAPLFTFLCAFILIIFTPRLSYFFMTSSVARPIFRFVSNKWYFDIFYNFVFNKPFLKAAYTYPFLNIDKGLLEFIGPTGFFGLFASLSNVFRSFQTGKVWFYGVFLVVTFFYFVLFWVC